MVDVDLLGNLTVTNVVMNFCDVPGWRLLTSGRLLGFIIIIGIIVHCVRTVQIKRNQSTYTGPSMFAVTAFFVLGLIAAPFIIAVFIVFSIYRLIVYIYLNGILGQCFGGLLKGPDVVWAMETPEARSIITVLVLLKIPTTDVACSRGSYGKELLDLIRKVAQESLLNTSPKLTQLRRRSSLGYHYWINQENFDVESFVRFLDIREKSADGLTEKELGEMIGVCCNKPLPCQDTATWEILVGQQHLISPDMSDNKLFPVLFRIHHSLGDGVALLRLLIEGLADRMSATNKKKLWVDSHRKVDEDSGYENDSHDSLFKDPIPKDLAPQAPIAVKTNLKGKIKIRLESFKSILLPERKQQVPKLSGIHKSVVSKISAIRRWRRNTLSEVPRVIELKEEDFPRARSATPDPYPCINAIEYEDITSQNIATHLSVSELYMNPLIIPDTRNAWKDSGILLIISVIVTFVTIYRAILGLYQIGIPFVLKILRFAFFTPHMVFFQVYGGTDDQVLFGKPLSGEKIVSWMIENRNDTNLQSKIRIIRNRIGVKFTHVLFACLSRSLLNFYKNRLDHVPSTINVVLPARVDVDDLSKGLQTTATCKAGWLRARVTRLYGTRRALKRPFRPDNVSFSSSTESDPEEIQQKIDKLHKDLSASTITRGLKLDNTFTVAMMRLPVGNDGSHNFTELVNSVKNEYSRLRNAPDYVANYWLLRWVAHLAPIPCLKPFLSGAPCSLVVSNLPGPEDVIHIAQKPIHDIVFWVPNRGLNGVGIGMLSYCQRFSMGIVADKALIADPDEAHKIIAGIFDEVNNLVDIFGEHPKSDH